MPPPKRWSLVNVSADLREDISGREEDEGVTLRMSPLWRRTDVPACLRDDDDDWAKSALTLDTTADVGPPCAWEQYTDLGGLQPIHMLR